MKVVVIDKYRLKSIPLVMHISLLRWLELKTAGHCAYQYLKIEGWAAPTLFFIAKCPKCHCFFLTYEHGNHNLLMDCPVCKN